VAYPERRFSIADEHDAFVAHNADGGRELQRPTPSSISLQEYLRLRRPARGSEALTITPDGQWLVGLLQASQEHASPTASRARRIVFSHTSTRQTREYLYLLDSPALHNNSEILALSATQFLVLERDGNLLDGMLAPTVKKLYEIDITGATDISVLGSTGLTPIGGTTTLENATAAELAAAGIVPVSKRLAVDPFGLGVGTGRPAGSALDPADLLLVVSDDDVGLDSADDELLPHLVVPNGVADVVSVWQIQLPLVEPAEKPGMAKPASRPETPSAASSGSASDDDVPGHPADARSPSRAP
jgi:hypothetical protein